MECRERYCYLLPRIMLSFFLIQSAFSLLLTNIQSAQQQLQGVPIDHYQRETFVLF